MNDLVKELAEKATDQYRGDRGQFISELNIEMFAELIVRECIDVLVDVLPDIVREAKDGIHPIWHIKEHFGVKP